VWCSPGLVLPGSLVWVLVLGMVFTGCGAHRVWCSPGVVLPGSLVWVLVLGMASTGFGVHRVWCSLGLVWVLGLAARAQGVGSWASLKRVLLWAKTGPPGLRAWVRRLL